MLEYPALVDGEPGAYGVAFPDLPGLITVPRHRTLSTIAAASIAKKAIWLD